VYPQLSTSDQFAPTLQALELSQVINPAEQRYPELLWDEAIVQFRECILALQLTRLHLSEVEFLADEGSLIFPEEDMGSLTKLK